MNIFTRGFRGRRRDSSGRLHEPGQYLTDDFPVLSAGPTPRISLDAWGIHRHHRAGRKPSVELGRADGFARRVGRGGRSLRDALVQARYGLAWGLTRHPARRHRDGGRFRTRAQLRGLRTNLPLEDLLDGKAWVAYQYEGEELAPEHGGPARLLVPHLYFWKSAKWVRGIDLMLQDSPGFWGQLGYHDYGDPWREQRYQGD